MIKDIAIHWFRQDLRSQDNPAFYSASQHEFVLPIFILDDINSGAFTNGAASRVWLHHSLKNLNISLNENLHFFSGDALTIIHQLIEKYSVNAIYWNRCYEPWRIKRDAKIKKELKEKQILVKTFNGSLLWEPWEISKKDNTPYKVFTPFFKKGCLQAIPPRNPINKPKNITYYQSSKLVTSINDLNLMPEIEWDKSMMQDWQPGEQAAKKRLQTFLRSAIHNYKLGRNFPAMKAVSRLSPHLHFGEISPNQIWYAAKKIDDDENIYHFLSELGWREFSHSLLYYFKDLPTKNWQSKFNAFPWIKNHTRLTAWQKGQTGYPIVDAGMRELWQTGYIHNRIRMVVASFLIKNLMIDWREGERWFWDCLVDADLANNSASWQWVAGCGADAAPYYRIFNPITQGQKFDPHGEYTKKYLPELRLLPDKYLYNPWEAPEAILQQANIVLGKTYPKPIVDLKPSREKALEAYKALGQD